MRPTADFLNKRTMWAKLNDAHRSNRARKAIATHIDPNQRTKRNPYRGFVRDDQHLTILEFSANVLNHAQRPRGYGRSLLAIRRRVPCGVGDPANVLVMIFAVDLFDRFSFPLPISYFRQTLSLAHRNLARISNHLRRRARTHKWAVI